MVAHGTPCLGPVTQAGCGAICPAFGRGCYGCFGPMATPNTDALVPHLERLGMTGADVHRVFRTFNAAAEAFLTAAETAAAGEAVVAASVGRPGRRPAPRQRGRRSGQRPAGSG